MLAAPDPWTGPPPFAAFARPATPTGGARGVGRGAGGAERGGGARVRERSGRAAGGRVWRAGRGPVGRNLAVNERGVAALSFSKVLLMFCDL